MFGHDIERDEMAVKRLINRVSVDAAFFKKLSPYENLVYAARLYGLDARKAKADAVRILERLGISEKRLGRPLEQMSRGMQQKVAIARALLTSPVLLLLDEPTTGLDPRSKLDVQTFVEDMRDEHDATIVLTTHDLDEADRLCDRIAILNDGRIVEEDAPAALKAMVAERYGMEPTLESAFMRFTGRSLDDDIEEDDTRTTTSDEKGGEKPCGFIRPPRRWSPITRSSWRSCTATSTDRARRARSVARCGAGSVVSWCESAPGWRQTRLCGRSGPCKGTRAGVAHVDRSNRNGTHDPRAEGVLRLR